MLNKILYNYREQSKKRSIASPSDGYFSNKMSQHEAPSLEHTNSLIGNQQENIYLKIIEQLKANVSNLTNELEKVSKLSKDLYEDNVLFKAKYQELEEYLKSNQNLEDKDL